MDTEQEARLIERLENLEEEVEYLKVLAGTTAAKEPRNREDAIAEVNRSISELLGLVRGLTEIIADIHAHPGFVRTQTADRIQEFYVKLNQFGWKKP